MNRYDVLDAARRAVRDREQEYGSPAINYQRQADFANVILKDKLKTEFPISAADMVLLHILSVKASRLIEDPSHQDSQIDIAGYAAILSEIA